MRQADAERKYSTRLVRVSERLSTGCNLIEIPYSLYAPEFC